VGFFNEQTVFEQAHPFFLFFVIFSSLSLRKFGRGKKRRKKPKKKEKENSLIKKTTR
jgi:hypothetical protein